MSIFIVDFERNNYFPKRENTRDRAPIATFDGAQMNGRKRERSSSPQKQVDNCQPSVLSLWRRRTCQNNSRPRGLKPYYSLSAVKQLVKQGTIDIRGGGI
jgi:hypothetical protein